MDRRRDSLEQRFGRLEERFEARFGRLEATLEARFGLIDQRFMLLTGTVIATWITTVLTVLFHK